jgi:hypothetical protein
VFPDIRLSLNAPGIGAPVQFSVEASADVAIQFDPATQALVPVIDNPQIDLQVVGGCKNGTSDYQYSYGECGRGGTFGLSSEFTFTSLLDYIANSVVLPIVTDSIGSIDLPSLEGLVPGFHAAFSSVHSNDRGGYLAIYANLRPLPVVSVALSQNDLNQTLQFEPGNYHPNVDLTLPNTTANWIVDDEQQKPVPQVLFPDPDPNNSLGATLPIANFVEANGTFGPQRVAQAKMTIVQPGLTVSASGIYTWYPAPPIDPCDPVPPPTGTPAVGKGGGGGGGSGTCPT